MDKFKRFQYHIVGQKCQEVRKFPSVIRWPTLLQIDNLFTTSKNNVTFLYSESGGRPDNLLEMWPWSDLRNCDIDRDSEAEVLPGNVDEGLLFKTFCDDELALCNRSSAGRIEEPSVYSELESDPNLLLRSGLDSCDIDREYEIAISSENVDEVLLLVPFCKDEVVLCNRSSAGRIGYPSVFSEPQSDLNSSLRAGLDRWDRWWWGGCESEKAISSDNVKKVLLREIFCEDEVILCKRSSSRSIEDPSVLSVPESDLNSRPWSTIFLAQNVKNR